MGKGKEDRNTVHTGNHQSPYEDWYLSPYEQSPVPPGGHNLIDKPDKEESDKDPIGEETMDTEVLFDLSEEEPRKPSRQKPGDWRFKECVELVRQHMESMNQDFEPSKGFFKNLKSLLAAKRSQTPETFRRWLENRALSDINPAEEPMRWIGKLSEYAAGPLDRYGKPKNMSYADEGRGEDWAPGELEAAVTRNRRGEPAEQTGLQLINGGKAEARRPVTPEEELAEYFRSIANPGCKECHVGASIRLVANVTAVAPQRVSRSRGSS